MNTPNKNANQKIPWLILLPSLLLFCLGCIQGFYLFEAIWKWFLPKSTGDLLIFSIAFFFAYILCFSVIAFVLRPIFGKIIIDVDVLRKAPLRVFLFSLFLFLIPFYLYTFALSSYALPVLYSDVNSFWDLLNYEVKLNRDFKGLILSPTCFLPFMWFGVLSFKNLEDEKKE